MSARAGDIVGRVEAAGLVAIVRAGAVGVEKLVDAAGALWRGGARAMEVTLNTPGALAAIAGIRAAWPGLACGAGTVLGADDARAAIAAGAQFVVTPALDAGTVAACGRTGVPVAAGCASPTEAVAAHAAGAAWVKVFPANRFGLVDLREILAELPRLRLVPTGGVTAANCAAYFAAGCAAVAAGSNLVSKASLAAADWAGIESATRELVGAVARGRVTSSE